jgi:hypothetical protein
MEVNDMSIETFTGKEGAVYDVYAEDAFQFKMKLIDVRAEKEHPVPKWEAMVKYRLKPFSLIFESDKKIHLKKNMIVDGHEFDHFPLKIEAIAESKTGLIYQAVFG